MNIWLSSEFEKSVRAYYSGRQQRVWDLLSTYLRVPGAFENDRRNNDYKPLKHSVCGGARPVMKYQIDDGGRIFLIEMDEALAASLSVDDAECEVRPSGGDFVFIGITGKPQHERQGHFGSLFGRRFYNHPKVHPYKLAVKTPPVQEKREDQKDRNEKIDFAAGMYAARIPFESYQEYAVSVGNADVKLSNRQYEILNKIVNDSRKRVAILMGCAGSGKTLMAVTSLLCSGSTGVGADKPRMYFSLSERLASSSETVYSKILACKTASVIEWDEGLASPWYRQFAAVRDIAIKAPRMSVSDLWQRAADQGIDRNEIVNRFERPSVRFADTNTYLISVLGRDVRARVLYDRFKTEFFQRECRDEHELQADDLWTEIRGLIKGYLGAHTSSREHTWYWGRCEYPQLRDMFHGGLPPQADLQVVQACLKRLGYVIDRKVGEHGFIWKDISDAAERAVRKECPQQAEMVSGMFEAVRRNDFTKKAMTLGEYLNLGPTQSSYCEQDRRRIYRLYEKYDRWLQANRLYDENDLARELLCRLDSDDDDSVEKLDLDVLVIDECQDLSEMQLLALSSLVGSHTRVIFAGDRHQVINPTYFDPERLYTILSLRNAQGVVECEKYFVNDNHRSSREVVGIANVISALRRNSVGKYSPEFELEEHSDVGGFYPHFLRYGASPDTISRSLERVARDPDVAFVVHDAPDKSRLVSLLPPSLRLSAEGNTFTIKECKGLEFKKVFCFDILGKPEYRWAWDAILSPQGVRHADDRGKYRYYFNTLYVAITRSQSGICLLESDEAARRHQDWFVGPGGFRNDGVESFDRIVTEFGLKVGTALEWLEHARGFLRSAEDAKDREMFLRALNAFRDASGKDDATEIVRTECEEGCHQCEIEIAKLNRRHREAALKCFEYRCLDRLPNIAMVSDEEQPDVQLLIDFAQKGFEGCSPAQTKKLIKMLSGTDSGRGWLSDMLEMRMSALAYTVAHAADRKSA